MNKINNNNNNNNNNALFTKRLWHGCFPVNLAKILRTPILQNTSGKLLLKMDIFQNSCSTEYQAHYMIKIFETYQRRSSILVKLQTYFVRDLPVAASK